MKRLINLTCAALLAMNLGASKNAIHAQAVNKKTQWQQSNGSWYAVDEKGRIQKGWIQDDELCWYFLDTQTGVMKTGWQQLEGKWYYLNPLNGIMQTGWKLLNNNWYYFLTSGQYAGAMATGELEIDGVVYHFDDKGILLDDYHQILIDLPESASANKKFDVFFKNIEADATVTLKIFDEDGKELDAKNFDFVFNGADSKLSIKSTGKYELVFVYKDSTGSETEIKKSIKITSRGGAGGTYTPPNIDIGGGGTGGEGEGDEDSTYARLHISQPLNLNVTNQSDIKAVAWTVVFNGQELQDTGEYLIIDGLKVVKFLKEGKYDLTAKIVTRDEKIVTSTGHIAVYNNQPVVESITGIGNDLDMEHGITMPGDDLYFTAVVKDLDVENIDQLDIEWKLDGQEVEFSKVGFAIDNISRGDHILSVTAIDPEGKRSEPLIYKFAAMENSKVIFKFENGAALHVSLPVSYGTVNEQYIDNIDWTVINTGDDSIEENALTVDATDHQFKFNHKGNYKVTATVTDKFGRVTECTSGVYVYNIDPSLPEIDLSHTDFIGSTTAYEGETFSFSVTSTDPDAGIVPTVVVQKNDIANDSTENSKKGTETETIVNLKEPQKLITPIVGLGEEDFTDLSPDLMEKYGEQFKYPEKFARIAGEIIAVKQPATNEHREKPMMHHSGPDL